jgi:hypothetical protein
MHRNILSEEIFGSGLRAVVLREIQADQSGQIAFR